MLSKDGLTEPKDAAIEAGADVANAQEEDEAQVLSAAEDAEMMELSEPSEPESAEGASADGQSEAGAGSAGQSFAAALYDWVEILAIAISLVILLFNFVGRVATVSGGSMLPTLTNGERLLIQQAFYEPKRGDIVICQSASYGMEEPLVKRVIALEGQTVKIDFETWQVFVDGEELTEPYINFVPGVPMKGWDYGESYTVPMGCVFVMGDNRNNSQDSRRVNVGPIDKRLIVGKAVVGFSGTDGVRVFD